MGQTDEKNHLYGSFRKLVKVAKVFTVSEEGKRMETKYLNCERSGEISIQMLNRSSVFKDFVGTRNYIQENNSKTILRITYQFNLRFPYGLITPLVFMEVRNIMRNKLTFLEAYLEYY